MKRKRNIRSSILLLACCLIACTNKESNYTNNKYFQYYISTIHIDNPRIVNFHDLKEECNPYGPPMSNFVCPDSAVKYCTESNWINRSDVFLLNSSSYNQEREVSWCDGFRAYGNWLYKFKPWEVTNGVKEMKPYNDTICIGHFYFEENISFILSMHTTDYWLYSENSYVVDTVEYQDLFEKSEYFNTYRLAVRPKYSIWQNIQIHKSIQSEIENYDIVNSYN